MELRSATRFLAEKELGNRFGVGGLEASRLVESWHEPLALMRSCRQGETGNLASLPGWFPRGRFNLGADDHSDVVTIGTLLESWEAWGVYFEFVRSRGLEQPLLSCWRNMVVSTPRSIVTDSERVVSRSLPRLHTQVSTVSPSAEARRTIHYCRFRVKERNLIGINQPT